MLAIGSGVNFTQNGGGGGGQQQSSISDSSLSVGISAGTTKFVSDQQGKQMDQQA